KYVHLLPQCPIPFKDAEEGYGQLFICTMCKVNVKGKNLHKVIDALMCKKSRAACREYAVRFPDRRQPHRSVFTERDGSIHYHNSHYWCEMNPHLPRILSFQHEFQVNVWAGMIDEYLIGSHILPHRITAHHFLQFLNNDLFDLLQNVPLNLRYDSWLQLMDAQLTVLVLLGIGTLARYHR
ncbi:hypothetical protein X777_07637, partial [Ooceraea biroi]